MSCQVPLELLYDSLIYGSSHNAPECGAFLGSTQTEALFLSLFMPPFCSHATAKAPRFLAAFECTTESQSHLFGN